MQRQSVTTKFIYKNMLEPRCIPPRVLTIHLTITFSETWKWVQCHFQTHNTGILHGVSPTKFYLHKVTCTSLTLLKIRNVMYVSCLLNECSVLHGLWSFVSSVLLDLTGCQVNISLNAILFNIFKQHTLSHYNDLLMLLINLVKKIIWTLRNQAKLEFLKVTHIYMHKNYVFAHSSLTYKNRLYKV